MGIKDLLSGLREVYLGLRSGVSATAGVALSQRRVVNHPLRIVRNTANNIVTFRVRTRDGAMNFTGRGSKKNSEDMFDLLKKAKIDSDIIRIETSDEGYIVDERKIK